MLQRYEAYKKSDVEWLGEIPDVWKLVRIASVFQERKEKVSDKDFKPLSVTKNGILPQLKNAAKTNDGDNRKLVKKGDFVINSRSDRKGSSGIAQQDGSVSLINIVMETKGIDPSFCNQILKSYGFIEEYYRIGHGIVADLWTTRYSEMKTVLLPLPPLPEQTAIAKFLNEKTAKIDELVGIKRRQIALLRERKQILIQNAVTKGLNPDAPMKDSGVEWIGEIPAHWEVKRLKDIASITPGFAFKSSEFIVETNPEFRSAYKLLRGINVNPGKVSWRDTVYWNSDQSKLIDNYNLAYGDIVIGMDRPWVSGGIRVAQITATDLPSLLLQRVARIRSNPKVHNYFIRMLITSRQFLVYFEPILTGISVPHISDSQIGGFSCAIPPLKEQEYIFKFQMKVERDIDTAIKIKQSQIEKLNEYKTTLINAAVTGKIKVV